MTCQTLASGAAAFETVTVSAGKFYALKVLCTMQGLGTGTLKWNPGFGFDQRAIHAMVCPLYRPSQDAIEQYQYQNIWHLDSDRRQRFERAACIAEFFSEPLKSTRISQLFHWSIQNEFR